MHAQLCSGARVVNCGLSLHLPSYFVCVRSEGLTKTVMIRRLIVVIPAHLCNKIVPKSHILAQTYMLDWSENEHLDFAFHKVVVKILCAFLAYKVPTKNCSRRHFQILLQPQEKN